MQYRFRTIHTWSLIIVAFISATLILCFLIRLSHSISLNKHLESILFVSLLIGGPYILSSFFSKGEIEVELKDKFLSIYQTKKGLLERKKESKLPLKSILYWRYKTNAKHYKLEIKTDVEKLSFFRNESWDLDKDDFSKFLLDFEQKIKLINTNRLSEGKAKVIDGEVDHYRGVYANAMLKILILITVFLIIALVLLWNSIENKVRIPMIVYIFGGLSYLATYMRKIRAANNGDK